MREPWFVVGPGEHEAGEARPAGFQGTISPGQLLINTFTSEQEL
jgi:hypothetical protein